MIAVTLRAAGLAVLLAISGCGGNQGVDESLPRLACAGIGPSAPGSGEPIGDGVSSRTICRSSGQPRSANRRRDVVVWDYGCGITWHFKRDHAKLVLTDRYDPFCSPKGRSPTGPLTTPPRDLSRAAKARYSAGSYVAGSVGCLACHRIASNGNDGPGPDLTAVGSRLPPAAIAEVLRRPTAPMPSFARLPRRRFNDLVFFLARLRSGR